MAVYHVTDGTSEADASKRLRITVRRTSSGGKHITLAKYKRKADEIEVVKQGMQRGRTWDWGAGVAAMHRGRGTRG